MALLFLKSASIDNDFIATLAYPRMYDYGIFVMGFKTCDDPDTF